MEDENKTKKQLINELKELRRRVAKLEKAETEHMQAEEAMRESEGKYRSLIENLKDIVFTIDLGGKINFASPSSEEILGYKSEEVINMNIIDFVPVKNRQRAIETIPKGMNGEKITQYQTQAITKSGERVILEVSFSRIYEKGATVGALAIARDITDRKRAEEEIRKVQERFSGLYNSSKDAIGWADPDGKLVDVNPSFSKLTGYSKEELLAGKRYQDLTPKEYREWETRLVEGVMKTGKPAEYEKEYIRKDGSRVPILLTVFDVKGSEGKSIGAAAIIKDITERKQVEKELKEKMKDLEIFHDAAVDRERKMEEMRSKIEELENKLKEG